MRDFATSDSAAVQAQLDRLAALSLPQGRIGIEAIRELLSRLGNPHLRLPPTFHVAGTNGKGSTCAYLRAILEAEGLRVHATISPHLVRYNERIRIAGKLIEDDALADLLKEVLDKSEGLGVSFFETTIAAAFLSFAREPGDVCILETGLGGRFDATNVIENPVVCGIATLGIDHERFLLSPEAGTPEEPIARIAFEKAGIIKPGSPVVTMAYEPTAANEIIRAANTLGAPPHMRGDDWSAAIGQTIEYRDARGALSLPLPTLTGAHQADNAALAVAMLRHQDTIAVSRAAMAEGIRSARWPARLQRLTSGPLTDLAPGHEIWLDGGHNPDAAAAIARHFKGQPLHLIVGMLANKDPLAVVGPLSAQTVNLHSLEIPGHESHSPDAFGPTARPARNIEEALQDLPNDGLPLLICGSLYLAGDVLKRNGELPD